MKTADDSANNIALCQALPGRLVINKGITVAILPLVDRAPRIMLHGQMLHACQVQTAHLRHVSDFLHVLVLYQVYSFGRLAS